VSRPNRRLGQHFLADRRILARIADALAPGPHDTVLEIGPGHGGLTAPLQEKAGQVIAIEKDGKLVIRLRNQFPKVKVVEGDALEIDWHAVAGPEFLLTGNIPYNITSPLIDKALTPPLPSRIVFLVQKEVADRVTARPNSSAYGALSVGVRSVARVERLFGIRPGSFHPPPTVDSTVLRLTPHETPLVNDSERVFFRRLVVGLFGFRRKQLARGLRSLTGWDAASVGELLGRLGLDERARPETLAPEQFVALLRGLVDGGWAPR
jgi:16S rRNA (adenine1518-N6/adenine1519-N6)-dimethyltransferase